MNKLPLETITHIFGYLDREDLLSMYRVDHGYRSVAAHYLGREIHITYHVDDLKWLRQIANTRDAACAVRTIYFECDGLPQVDDDDKNFWREYVIDESTRMPKPTIPPPDMYGHVNLEDQTKYYSDLHTFRNQKRHDYDEMELETGWQQFRELNNALKRLRGDMTPKGPWAVGRHILLKMPNLRTLIFDCNNTIRPQSSKWESHFRSGLTHRSEYAKGIFDQVVVWLMYITRYSKAQLSTLRLGLHDWDSLIVMETLSASEVEENWRLVCTAVQHLRHLEMNWTTLPEVDYDGPYIDIEKCYRFFETFTRLHQLLTAARELEQLTLVFRPNWHSYSHLRSVFYEECDIPIYPPDRTRTRYMARLEDCFQNTKWDFLTNLKLWGIESDHDDQLIAFFRRHPRIQHLDLKNMGLRKGSWLKVFEAIREPDRVSTCILAGEFHSRGPTEEIWDLERPTEKGAGVFDEAREKRRKDLQEWVCNRPRRPAPSTGTTVEWRRIWGMPLEGVGYPYLSPLRWHLQP